MAATDIATPLLNNGVFSTPESRTTLSHAFRKGSRALRNYAKVSLVSDVGGIDAVKARELNSAAIELAEMRHIPCAVGKTAIRECLDDEVAPFAASSEVASDPEAAVYLATETLIGISGAGQNPREVNAVLHVLDAQAAILEDVPEESKGELIKSATNAIDAIHEQINAAAETEQS